MSGKETQENWELQSVKNGKLRGVSVYESGYLVQVVANEKCGSQEILTPGRVPGCMAQLHTATIL